MVVYLLNKGRVKDAKCVCEHLVLPVGDVVATEAAIALASKSVALLFMSVFMLVQVLYLSGCKF